MIRSFDEHRSTWAGALVLAGLFGLAALSATIDDRLIEGASVWAKPMKFAASFALHLATLAVLAQLIVPDRRGGGWTTGLLAAATAAALVEVFYVYLQSARGRTSHFNFDTGLETFLYYGVMGGAALVIVAATIGLGVMIARHPAHGIGPGLRAGAVLGLIVGGVATFAVAGPMASGDLTRTGRWIGGSLTHADGLPLVGWSTTGGDLRVPHFFATHLVQVLPLLGLIADRITPAFARAIVLCGLVAMLVVTGATFLQAMSGQAFLRLTAAGP